MPKNLALIYISNLKPETRAEIRQAVSFAMEVWPNSHLGDYSRREDMASAFRMIRRHADQDGIHAAIGALERNAHTYVDM